MTGDQAFSAAYRRAVDDLLPYIRPEVIGLMARHNPDLAGWRPEQYLRLSERRYRLALMLHRATGGPELTGAKVLDTGGFTGAFALALARTGADVTITETYSLYHGGLDDLRDRLVAEGVTVWDLDVTAPVPEPRDRFDLVTNMAMLEHLAHSPKALADNLRAFCAPQGRVIVEVPNVAAWPKRVEALLGRSTLPALRSVYVAETPFTGHHREYTVADLRDLLAWSALDVRALETFNYTPLEIGGWRRLALDWPRRRFASCREVIMACAAPR